MFLPTIMIIGVLSWLFMATTSTTSSDENVDIQPSQEESGGREKKKGRSRNIDHDHHHPAIGCKFNVLWDDDVLVYDETVVNLSRKLSVVANNFSLLPMDKTWKEQNKQNIKDAMRAIKVNNFLTTLLFLNH